MLPGEGRAGGRAGPGGGDGGFPGLLASTCAWSSSPQPAVEGWGGEGTCGKVRHRGAIGEKKKTKQKIN